MRKSKAKNQAETPSLDNFLDEITEKAYEIFQKRVEKNKDGNDVGDWLEAEKVIKKKYKIS